MPKKDDKKSHLHHPDYESFKTVAEVQEAIRLHEARLVGKDKTESQIKKEKREYTAALNEQLRELREEREHEIGVLSALDQRIRALHAEEQGFNVVPLPVPKPAVG